MFAGDRYRGGGTAGVDERGAHACAPPRRSRRLAPRRPPGQLSSLELIDTNVNEPYIREDITQL